MEINNNQKTFHVVSPLIESDELSSWLKNAQNDTKVYLKLENVQPSGSFKMRGIGHLINEVINPSKNSILFELIQTFYLKNDTK